MSLSSLVAVITLLGFANNTCRNAEGFGFSFPQPAGLSQEVVTKLATERYGADDSTAPMDGRVAVITGAAGGIGRELSEVLHRLGCTVVALDRNVTGLNNLKDSLGSDRVITLPTQHEDLASVAHSAEQIKSCFSKLDLLINNAGMTYPPGTQPGQEWMKSKHGMDLAFTVNYLSHFLLVEKLLPLLSDPRCRIVHLTSTYHWKVDGSELIPAVDATTGPIAYQSDPSLQGPKHVERSYANTKLAQIWHSRSIRGCQSACACPTWVGTGIGGDDARASLELMAFPVSGAGIASALNAIFQSEEALGDALNDGKSLVANSRMLEYLPAKNLWTSDLVTRDLGWRDGIVDFGGLLLLLGQRFTFEEFLVQRSSPESFNNKERRDALYGWSMKEVQPWL